MLVEQVAQLSYLNKDHMLFFRGQPHDYRNKAASSTIYPSIYRGERTPKEQLELYFAVLESASSRLCRLFEERGLSSHKELRRRRYIQWSILQHYEVCATPLLDLTHSLRVACSFAFLSNSGTAPYVYVFGLPYMTNRISTNSEHELVNIRLLSICPPEALRPHFQEGYLAGTEDVLYDFESKSELDFNNRLIAKYKLDGDKKSFWNGGFKPYPKSVLYPAEDVVLDLCEGLKRDLDTGVTPGRVGSFLQEWAALESSILRAGRALSGKIGGNTVLSSLEVFRRTEKIDSELLGRLHEVRKTRNQIVHQPDRASNASVSDAIVELKSLEREFGRWWRENF